MSYTKLFSEIVMSTIWREPNHIRIVWITMLALRDQYHTVQASIPGLADAARVTMDECEEAIKSLSSPDHYSRSQAHEGRRIEVCDGGWLILNGEKYRIKMSSEDRRRYKTEKQREYRARDKPVDDSVDNSRPSGHSRVEQSIEEKIKQPCQATPDRDVQEVFEYWMKVMGKTIQTKLTPKRKQKIIARLKTYPVTDITLAILNCSRSPHNMGENERKTMYNDIELICRDDTKLEYFRDSVGQGAGGKSGESTPRELLENNNW